MVENDVYPLHLAVALEGVGWHPAAWRDSSADPRGLFTAQFWIDQIQEAERGLLDFVTIEDSISLQSSRHDDPDERVDQVRGRLSALLIATVAATHTTNIGLVPTVMTSYAEPYTVSSEIATLDLLSKGRAGWRLRVPLQRSDGLLFGRLDTPEFDISRRFEPKFAALIASAFEDAAEFVALVRSFWDSWDDDALVIDRDTGKFIDRAAIRSVDFDGARFRAHGKPVTPRPLQGQPPVTALAHYTVPYRLAARATDVVYVTPHNIDQVKAIVSEVRVLRAETANRDQPLKILADFVVFFDRDSATASARKDRLDSLDGSPVTSDAEIFIGSPREFVDLLEEWQAAGIEGFRLRPGVLDHDLKEITNSLVPEMQSRGLFRTRYEQATLRGLLNGEDSALAQTKAG